VKDFETKTKEPPDLASSEEQKITEYESKMQAQSLKIDEYKTLCEKMALQQSEQSESEIIMNLNTMIKKNRSKKT